MKVKIGPYRKKKPKKVKIRIDKWDTWSMDHTLALIILPMLKQLKKYQHGSPYVEREDLPEELRYTTHKEWEDQLYFDFYHDTQVEDNMVHERWAWIMDEMIWSFEQIVRDDDSEFFDHSEVNEKDSINDQMKDMKVDWKGLNEYHDRIENGLRLFGKYYKGLWD